MAEQAEEAEGPSLDAIVDALASRTLCRYGIDHSGIVSVEDVVALALGDRAASEAKNRGKPRGRGEK